MNIDEYRQQHPGQLDDISDEQITNAIYAKVYSGTDLSLEEFQQYFNPRGTQADVSRNYFSTPFDNVTDTAKLAVKDALLGGEQAAIDSGHIQYAGARVNLPEIHKKIAGVNLESSVPDPLANTKQIRNEHIRELATHSVELDYEANQRKARDLTPEGLDTVQKGMRSGWQSFLTSLPALLATPFAGPTPLIGLFTAMTGGQNYIEARNAGKPPDEAMSYATKGMTITAVTEALPAKYFSDMFKAWKKSGDESILKKFAKMTLAEIPGEQAETFLSSLNAYQHDLNSGYAEVDKKVKAGDMSAADGRMAKAEIQAEEQAIAFVGSIVGTSAQGGAGVAMIGAGEAGRGAARLFDRAKNQPKTPKSKAVEPVQPKVQEGEPVPQQPVQEGGLFAEPVVDENLDAAQAPKVPGVQPEFDLKNVDTPVDVPKPDVITIEGPSPEGEQAVESPPLEGEQAVESPPLEGEQAVEKPTLEGEQAVESPVQEGEQAVEKPVLVDEQPPEEDLRQDTDSTVVTPTGTEVAVRPEIVELSDIKTSHDLDGRVNPEYPQEIQPRQRERKGLVAEIKSERLDPRLLMPTIQVGDGAPTIGQDNAVESGNGRILRITDAYKNKPEEAKAYREALKTNGYTIDGMAEPVLVQRRTQPMTRDERIRFAEDARVPSIAAFGAGETAAMDARRMGKLIDLYQGGDPAAKANQDFVHGFIRDVASKDQSMRDKNNYLSQEGIRRIENAVFQAAYETEELVGAFRESTDSNIKTLGNSLQEAAGDWAKMRKAAKDEAIDPAMDINDALVSALNEIRRAKAEGISVSDQFNQVDLLDKREPSQERALADLFFQGEQKFQRYRSAAKIAQSLKDYAKYAMQTKKDSDLLGDKVTPERILQTLAEQKGEQENTDSKGDKQGDLLTAKKPEVKKPKKAKQQKQATADTSDVGDELYSRDTPDAVSGLKVADVTHLLAERVGKRGWKNLSKILTVVQSETDLPADIQHPEGGVQDVFDGENQSYLVADNLTMDEAWNKVFHVVGVHHGLRHIAGKEEMDQVLAQVSKLEKAGNKRVLEAKARVPKDTPAEHVSEEILAYLVDNQENRSMSVVKRILAAIRRFLRRLGVVNGLNVDDLVQIVKGNVERVLAGHGGAGGKGAGAVYSRKQPSQFVPPENVGWNRAKNFVMKILEDRFSPLRTVSNWLEQYSGQELNDANDAFSAQVAYPGMVEYQQQKFHDTIIDPMLKMMDANNISFGELGRYLHAWHAEKANAVLKERNAKVKDNDAMSGMTNEEAQEILQEHEAHKKLDDIVDGKNKALKKLHFAWDRMNNRKLDLLVDGGIITDAQGLSLKQTFPHYAPMRRHGHEDASPSLAPKGQGFHQPKKDWYILGGSRERVDHDNLIVYGWTGYYDAIARVEKNKVLQSLHTLVETHENSYLWTTDRKEMPKMRVARRQNNNEGLAPDEIFGMEDLFIRDSADTDKTIDGEKIHKENGIEFILRPDYRHQNVLRVKFSGKEEYIYLNKDNYYANNIALAMKNLDIPQMAFLAQLLHGFSFYFSGINTWMSMEFMVSNFSKDLPTALINVSDTMLDGHQVQILADVPAAAKGLIDYKIRGKTDSYWAKLAEEYHQYGGETGWTKHYENVLKASRRIKFGHAMGKHEGLKQLKWLFTAIVDANNVVENIVRLAIYKKAHEDLKVRRGLAIQISKKSSVDFNQTGTWMRHGNLLWVFLKPAINGIFRSSRSLKNSKTTQKIAVGLVLYGLFQYLFNWTFGGEEEFDEETGKGVRRIDMVPDYYQDMNFLIMGPTGDAAKFPMPWFWNTFPIIGQQVGEAMLKPDYDVGEGIARIVSNIYQAYNPLYSASTAQMLAPTILDPAVQIWTNETWLGRPLLPRQRQGEMNKDRHFGRSTQAAEKIAEGLYRATLDEETLEPMINVSPVWIDLIGGFLTGGTGRLIGSTIETATNILQGEKVETRRIPGLRKLFSEWTDHDVNSYGQQKVFQVLNLSANLKAIKKDKTRREEAEAYAEMHADILSLGKRADKTRDRVNRAYDKLDNLRREIKELKNNGGENADAEIAEIKAQIEEKEADINGYYRDFMAYYLDRTAE